MPLLFFTKFKKYDIMLPVIGGFMKNNIKNNIDDKNSCTSLVIKKGLTNVQSLILYLYM